MRNDSHADPVQAREGNSGIRCSGIPDTVPKVIDCLAYPLPLISLPPASVGSAVCKARYKVVGLVNEFELNVYCSK